MKYNYSDKISPYLGPGETITAVAPCRVGAPISYKAAFKKQLGDAMDPKYLALSVFTAPLIGLGLTKGTVIDGAIAVVTVDRLKIFETKATASSYSVTGLQLLNVALNQLSYHIPKDRSTTISLYDKISSRHLTDINFQKRGKAMQVIVDAFVMKGVSTISVPLIQSTQIAVPPVSAYHVTQLQRAQPASPENAVPVMPRQKSGGFKKVIRRTVGFFVGIFGLLVLIGSKGDRQVMAVGLTFLVVGLFMIFKK